MYLAAAGVGTIALADGDEVDLTNLQRQILHSTASVGRPKALSGRETLGRLNPGIRVEALAMRLEGPALAHEVARADVVLDCSDNFATRHAVNGACVAHAKPLVSGAGVRFDGQLAVFDLRRADSPCYECLFPQDTEVEETRCAVMGVFAPLTGIIGTLQAAEALKLLGGIGETLSGRLILFDALAAEWRSVRLHRDPACRVCAKR
jgi:adenylyltransferase/sulfurtransferase